MRLKFIINLKVDQKSDIKSMKTYFLIFRMDSSLSGSSWRIKDLPDGKDNLVRRVLVERGREVGMEVPGVRREDDGLFITARSRTV